MLMLVGLYIMHEKTLQQSDKQWIEHYLRKVDFVKWDRFLYLRDKEGKVWGLGAYGWIDRKDSYKDICYIEFIFETHEVVPVITSSKKYSKKIVEILSSKDSPHFDCQRIENKFNISNSIKLK